MAMGHGLAFGVWRVEVGCRWRWWMWMVGNGNGSVAEMVKIWREDSKCLVA